MHFLSYLTYSTSLSSFVLFSLGYLTERRATAVFDVRIPLDETRCERTRFATIDGCEDQYFYLVEGFARGIGSMKLGLELM